jgi:hypothetical protein
VGPFDDASDANELLLAQLGRKAPLLSSISVVAPELDALVAGMLAKDPRERPADARQVAEALRSLATRYERSVSTDVPTHAGVSKASAIVEPPTRVEGRRASQPAPAPATRPDGVAAARGPASANTTAIQPPIELQTTTVPQSSRPRVTQRLVEQSAPELYGPDTLVDSVTSAPTAAPGAQGVERPERTEMLLVVPPTPTGQAPADTGVTRTAVPIAEAPNLTPPPVVPSPPVAPAKGSLRGVVLLGVAAGLVVVAAVAALRSTAGVSPSAEPAASLTAPVEAAAVTAAAAAVVSEPSAQSAPPAPAQSAPPAPSSTPAPPPSAVPREAAPVPLPAEPAAASSATSRKDEEILAPTRRSPAPERKPAPSGGGAPVAPASKAPSTLPASGL